MGLLLARAPEYLLQRRLAAGGMGEVYLGTQITSAGSRQVAIKRLPRAVPAVDHARARLVAEAQLVFQLTHTNICQVHDLGENEDGVFIVMEYVDGVDLGTLLAWLGRERRSLSLANAVYIAQDVARALDYAHRRPRGDGPGSALVHGDVTPRNILLSTEGEVKLADFGIARAIGVASGPGASVRGGTPGYLAPEVLGGAIDHRADIYSLGVTLYAALRGRSPRPGERMTFDAADAPPDELRRMIDRMTAQRAEDRYLSAAAVEQALAPILSRLEPSFTPAALAESVRACTAQCRPGAATATQQTRVSIATLVASPPRAERAQQPAVGDATRSVVATETTRWRWLGLAAVLVALGAATAAWGLWSRDPSPGRPKPPDGRTHAGGSRGPTPLSGAAVRATPDGETSPADQGHAATAGAPERAPGAKARAQGTRRTARTRRARAARTKAAAHAVARRPQRAPPGYLTVSSRPWGQVYLDGKRIAAETPLYRHPVRPGRHLVKIYYPGSKTFSKPQQVVLEPNAVRQIGFDR